VAIIRKVTDPKKIVTDPEMFRELVRQGIDRDYVEFHEDYTTEHPSAKFYRDLKSGKQFMVVSGLPRVEDRGRKIEVGWLAAEGRYYAKANLFSAVVEGTAVRVSIRLDKATWNPQLFLNGVEQSCSEATLLGVDPDNENYHNNVLEWDYGICKRRLRLTEGAILEKYIFDADPQGGVVIRSNWRGELRPCGYYAIDASDKSLPFTVVGDEKRVPASSFANAAYPVEIDDSLTVYSATGDGYTSYDNTNYTTCHDAPSGDTPDTSNIRLYHINQYAALNYTVRRSYTYFDTSPLGAGAVISATLSLYGKSAPTETDAGHPDIGVVQGVQDSPLAANDYGDNEPYTTLGGNYIDVSAGFADQYNDITLNATGRGWINKTGTTLFCTRARGDIDESTPTGSNIAVAYSADQGTGYQPKLVITYTAPVEKTSSDSGSGSETLLSRAYVLPEVGTGSEALGSRLLAAVEQGAGAETLLARLLAGAETALGLDAGGLIFTSSDVGSGSDVVLALEALLTGADSGSGIDTSFIIKALLSADSGLGTEAVAALLAGIVAGELMVGSDRLVVKIESAPTGGGMRLTPGGKTSIPSRRVNL